MISYLNLTETQDYMVLACPGLCMHNPWPKEWSKMSHGAASLALKPGARVVHIQKESALSRSQFGQFIQFDYGQATFGMPNHVKHPGKNKKTGPDL